MIICIKCALYNSTQYSIKKNLTYVVKKSLGRLRLCKNEEEALIVSLSLNPAGIHRPAHPVRGRGAGGPPPRPGRLLTLHQVPHPRPGRRGHHHRARPPPSPRREDEPCPDPPPAALRRPGDGPGGPVLQPHEARPGPRRVGLDRGREDECRADEV